jgi:pimeloyl-ACP methyl ester carboxylesterase
MAVIDETFELAYEDEPGRAIRGVVSKPAGTREKAAPTVLILHGFKGFMDWGFFPLLARGLAETGFVAVRFNASGSGVGADGVDFSDLGAFERDTISRQLEDVERVHQHLLSGEVGGVDPKRIGMVGHSRGGGVALLHAAQHPVQALVTWAAIDSVIRFEDATVERWRKDGFLDIPNGRTGQIMRMGRAMLEDVEQNGEALDILAAAKKVEAPTLLLHGSADEAVDPAAAERIREVMQNVGLEIEPDVGHTFGATHPLGKVGPELEWLLARTLGHLLTHLT